MKFYSFHLASFLSGVCLKGWGLTVTLGVPKVKPEITAHYGAFLTGRTLKGSLFGGWKPKSDLPSLVEMYMKKVIELTKIPLKLQERISSNMKCPFTFHYGRIHFVLM